MDAVIKFDRLYGNPSVDAYDAIIHVEADSVTPTQGMGLEEVTSFAINSGDSANTAGSDVIVLHSPTNTYTDSKGNVLRTFRFAVLDIPQGSSVVIQFRARITCQPYSFTRSNKQSVQLTKVFGMLGMNV